MCSAVSPEYSSYAVLHHTRQDLSTNTTHAHTPPGGRELIGPSLLCIAIPKRFIFFSSEIVNRDIVNR